MVKTATETTQAAEARDSWREARAAVNFWQALEYLSPQSPPAVKLEESVWEFGLDAREDELPWNDPKKRLVLDRQLGPTRKFQLFAGILDGHYFIEAARRYLGAEPIDQSERLPAKPVACVVINVNDEGMASGQVFISAVPWAIAQISRTKDHGKALDFRGFFGKLDEKIRASVEDLMVARRLLAKPADAAVPGEGRVPAKQPVAAVTLAPVTSADVCAITDLVFKLSGWVPAQQEGWRVQALRTNAKTAPGDATSDVSQDDPLNSFYAEDLEAVGDAVARKKIGVGLQAYLRGEDSTGRVDLESQVDQLIKGVHPSLLPAGCWPAKFPLVTAQQFAVNSAMRDLSIDGGLFSVNGPPGTGKTTMLKDIIAAIVVKRADALVAFDDPISAFSKRLQIDDYQYPIYELDPRLRDFGVVVSSANNGAVENITKELPSLEAIVPGIDVDYFSAVADSAAAPQKAVRRTASRERWGLITAVLGNKSNRSQFVNRFWFAQRELQKPPEGQRPPPPDPLRLRSLPDLVKTGEHGALSWGDARKQYFEARKKVDVLIGQASAAADAVQLHASATSAKAQALSELLDAEVVSVKSKEALRKASDAAGQAKDDIVCAEACVAACSALSNAEVQVKVLQDSLDRLRAAVPAARGVAQALREDVLVEIQGIRDDIRFHDQRKPGFFAMLFRSQDGRGWNRRAIELDDLLRKARKKEGEALKLIRGEQDAAEKIKAQEDAVETAKQHAATCLVQAQSAGVPISVGFSETEIPRQSGKAAFRMEEARKAATAALRRIDETGELARTAEQRTKTAQARRLRAEADLDNANRILSTLRFTTEMVAQWDISSMERDELHRAVPYDFPGLFAARREVFIAAMRLHQAFIVAAWKPLSGSLRAFVDLLQGKLSSARIPKGAIQLWDVFFLVVPVVSTTFASFPRLFQGVKCEQLAWLLIDEAGQATPQQAAGAIWRSKRSVIVGDPLQLEPVVGVPQELLTPLLDRCSAEPQWAPPQASAQTLADRANRFGMYLGEPDADDRIWLGSPLLVHRRCIDPMFSIANSIAYDNKMVHGTGKDSGPEGIGGSCWVHVPAEHSDGHWVQEQALCALELVERLSGGALKKNGQFKVYIITPFRTVSERIKRLLSQRYGNESNGMAGTVHTFQGKEAEHVIFLLGGNPSSPGVISFFAGAKPNLVNVAVTRAKRRLYVVGDCRFWTGSGDVHGIFGQMKGHLGRVVPAELLAQDRPDTFSAGYNGRGGPFT